VVGVAVLDEAESPGLAGRLILHHHTVYHLSIPAEVLEQRIMCCVPTQSANKDFSGKKQQKHI